MAIKVDCPICSKMMRARDEMMGRRVRCPGCKNEFKILLGHGGTPVGALSKAEAKRRMEQAGKAEQAARRAGIAGTDAGSGPVSLAPARLSRPADPVTAAAADAMAHEEQRHRARQTRRDLARKVGGFDIFPSWDLARWGMSCAAVTAGLVLVLWAVWMLGTAGFTTMGIGTWIFYLIFCVLLVFGINFFAGDSLVPVIILAVFSAFPVLFLFVLPFALQERLLTYWDWPLLISAGITALCGVFGFLQRLAARGRFGTMWPALGAIFLSVAAPAVRYSAVVSDKVGFSIEVIPSAEVLHVAIRYRAAYGKIYEALATYAEAHSLHRFPPNLERLVKKGLIKSEDLRDPITEMSPGGRLPGGLFYIDGQDAKMGRKFQNILVHSDDRLKPNDPHPDPRVRTGVPGRERVYVLYLGGMTAALHPRDFREQLKQTRAVLRKKEQFDEAVE